MRKIAASSFWKMDWTASNRNGSILRPNSSTVTQ